MNFDSICGKVERKHGVFVYVLFVLLCVICLFIALGILLILCVSVSPIFVLTLPATIYFIYKTS